MRIIMSLLGKISDISNSKTLQLDLTGKTNSAYQECKQYCITLFEQNDASFDINYTDIFGRSFLIMAAIIDDIEIANSILKKNPNLDHVCNSFHTALIMAVKMKSVDMCKILITAGADVNIIDNFKTTALVYAIKFGHEEIFRILIEAGAKLDLLYRFNDTVLHLSCRHQRLNFAIHLTKLMNHELIKCVNEYGKTATEVWGVSIWGDQDLICNSEEKEAFVASISNYFSDVL